MHLPFCVHRCGYCDFVTSVGRLGEHGRYVDALLAELARERHVLAGKGELESVFIGGGTPTFTEPVALARLLDGLPGAGEVTVEANPESLTPALARLLLDGGVNRVSLGAQSFTPRLLEVLERQATPDHVRRAVHTLRDAGFDNISLDLVYGIPGQSPSDLELDVMEALRLGPEHLSCYELEAKPGTRFTRAWSDELERQGAAMEGYFEAVVDLVSGSGYRWYETANFCLAPGSAAANGRDLRAHHNLGYWHAAPYLGIGVGAVSTLPREGAGPAAVRRRNLPSVSRYVGACLGGEPAPCETEELDAATMEVERLMLGLRLDEPFELTADDSCIDSRMLEQLEGGGLVHVERRQGRPAAIALTRRGRFLGGAVTAKLLRD
ncbi:MAG: coproporphyrinogen-III oxidase family protein [Gaiella sp.]